jgi:outer membrane protein OmpA-like peptidoglycan-associated protein
MDIPGSESFNASVNGVPVGLKLQEQWNNSFLVGLRYAFGVKPAPPPPAAAQVAPAPAPARTYQVFFDWDKATLTDRAREIVKAAAEASTKVQTTRIEVNGYTDTSGTPQYNKGLSIRRAEAVAAELVRDGVPRASIAIQGFGETHLLVPTGPGVREPQNRRVEIILH